MDDGTFKDRFSILSEIINKSYNEMCFNTISQVNKDEIEILCSDSYTKLNAEVKISIPKRKFKKWILKKLFGITISIKG